MNATTEIKVGSMVKVDGRDFQVTEMVEPGSNTKMVYPNLVAHALLTGERGAVKMAHVYASGNVKVFA